MLFTWTLGGTQRWSNRLLIAFTVWGKRDPVTIYRLIAKGTIEEKILALHQHKRELADTLLSDFDSTAQLSVSEMMAMLKDTF